MRGDLARRNHRCPLQRHISFSAFRPLVARSRLTDCGVRLLGGCSHTCRRHCVRVYDQRERVKLRDGNGLTDGLNGRPILSRDGAARHLRVCVLLPTNDEGGLDLLSCRLQDIISAHKHQAKDAQQGCPLASRI